MRGVAVNEGSERVLSPARAAGFALFLGLALLDIWGRSAGWLETRLLDQWPASWQGQLPGASLFGALTPAIPHDLLIVFPGILLIAGVVGDRDRLLVIGATILSLATFVSHPVIHRQVSLAGSLAVTYAFAVLAAVGWILVAIGIRRLYQIESRPQWPAVAGFLVAALVVLVSGIDFATSSPFDPDGYSTLFRLGTPMLLLTVVPATWLLLALEPANTKTTPLIRAASIAGPVFMLGSVVLAIVAGFTLANTGQLYAHPVRYVAVWLFDAAGATLTVAGVLGLRWQDPRAAGQT